MESWIIYGIVAAILISTRDLFTRTVTKKYTLMNIYYIIMYFVVLLLLLQF